MPMSCYFTICSTAKSQEIYMQFLLENYDALNLPYSFPVALSYISSPVLMGEECILIRDSNDEAAGALGFIRGTGAQSYEDQHILQIQTVFLKEHFRSSRLFLQASQFLAQHLAQLKHPVTELRFWIPAQPRLQRLCGKLAQKTAIQETVHGIIEEYRMDFADWHASMQKYPHELYF